MKSLRYAVCWRVNQRYFTARVTSVPFALGSRFQKRRERGQSAGFTRRESHHLVDVNPLKPSVTCITVRYSGGRIRSIHQEDNKEKA